MQADPYHRDWSRYDGPRAVGAQTLESALSKIKWKGFSKGKLKEHYDKHVIDQQEFGNISPSNYLKQAKDFAVEPGVFKEAQVGNILIKYDPDSGRVLVGNANSREIRTFYIDDGRSEDPFKAAVELAENL